MQGTRSSAPADDGRTRDRVTGLLLEHGPQTATELATRLGLSPAAVRRHLDALLADRPGRGAAGGSGNDTAHRGRGRPARRFRLTDAGRSTFPHAYDDLALTALRYVAATGGPDAVRAVAERQLAGLEQRCSAAVERAVARHGAPVDRAQALAGALSRPRATLPRPRRSPAGGSSASTTARWRTWPRSSPSCARPRPRSSAGWSARTSSAWPRSPTATGSAPRTSRGRCSGPGTDRPLHALYG